MQKDIPKAYNPKDFEDSIYKKWEDSGLFNPDNLPVGKNAETYTISVPPPNATGILHLGHALMLSYQDILIRFNRMKGKKTLWVPGEDHAALATNAKIELQLSKESKTKYDLGRSEFLHLVNTYVFKSRNIIRNQMKKMGSSLDWSRERYTLDGGLSRVVRIVFKKMFDDGLIYRGSRIVNWDYALQTTISDDELERKEEKAPLYFFKYGPFTIGTARPETKFGDKYVVMHPDDKRYKKYKHRDMLEVEWINGPVTATIIKDKAVDMEFGTGVMTITPWHDATDFEIAQRHKLDYEQIIDFDGKLLPIAQEFAGMSIENARKKIVKKLDKKKLLEKVDENYVHNIVIGDRSGVMIEPQIMEQWFVDVHKKVTIKGNTYFEKGASLVEVASKVVKSGEVKITPGRFNKMYFHWMDNLHDWCISRQIWFGHQIPIWKKGDEVYCGVEKPEGDGWEQDPDTLDTWFSSGLWTFSTLMKKESSATTLEELIQESPDLQYHPTQMLETGYDIIFTWVARMLLLTTYALGEIPFKDIYFHGLIRDKQGRKMSKSLGNGIDPINMIEKYGADALRLSMMVDAAPGNDSRLYEEKIAGYRNFVNKLWNISRYILTTVEKPRIISKKPKVVTLADKWILGRLDEVTAIISEDIEAFRFSKAANNLRHFTWDDVADWYLEVAKIEGGKDEILLYILHRLLLLWHPFTPFVTEGIWGTINDGNELLLIQKWPESKTKKDDSTYTDWKTVQEFITRIRTVRNLSQIPLKKILDVHIGAGDTQKLFKEQQSVVEKMANVHIVTIEETMNETLKESLLVSVTHKSTVVNGYLPVAGILDIVKERKRLEKEITQLEKFQTNIELKLGNTSFIDRAPEAIILEERQKLKEAKLLSDKYTNQIESLT